MIKNTGVIQTLCKKSLLYHKKDLTFEKYIIIVFCKSNLSNMSLKEFLCVICVLWFVSLMLFPDRKRKSSRGIVRTRKSSRGIVGIRKYESPSIIKRKKELEHNKLLKLQTKHGIKKK